MRRINYLVTKLASIAPKTHSLALVAACVFAASPMAFAQSCSFASEFPVYVSPGSFSGGVQLFVGNMGSSGAQVNVEYQQSGAFTVQSLGVSSSYTNQLWPAQGNQGLVTLYGYQMVEFGGMVPFTAKNGQTAEVTFTVWWEYSQCSQTVTLVVVDSPCSPNVTQWNGTSLAATWDGTGFCEIEPVPPGATGPFIYDNSYYVSANKTNTCAPGAGTYDGANCWYMVQPPGGTLWQNSFFVPSSGTICSTGTYQASTNNCLVKSAPWGTQAFQYTINGQVMWYFTPEMTCPIAGEWDGAHCYLMTAPAGKTAILLNNRFYYR